MKYMGSKRVMLQNGLGDLLIQEAIKHNRIVDLFSGAAAVSWFVAEKTNKEVLAIDIQEFAVVLAKSVICRNKIFQPDTLIENWLNQVEKKDAPPYCGSLRQQLIRLIIY